MNTITQKVFDWIMKNRVGMISEGNIKVAYEVITGQFPTRNDICNIYEEIELHYPPRRGNPANIMSAEEAMAEYRQQKAILTKMMTDREMQLAGKQISKEIVHDLWVTEAPVFVGNKKYIVRKMSYGTYFMEPAEWRGGETAGFAPGTLWLRQIPRTRFYELE